MVWSIADWVRIVVFCDSVCVAVLKYDSLELGGGGSHGVAHRVWLGCDSLRLVGGVSHGAAHREFARVVIVGVSVGCSACAVHSVVGALAVTVPVSVSLRVDSLESNKEFIMLLGFAGAAVLPLGLSLPWFAS